jgi:hypothetical protein
MADGKNGGGRLNKSLISTIVDVGRLTTSLGRDSDQVCVKNFCKVSKESKRYSRQLSSNSN